LDRVGRALLGARSAGLGRRSFGLRLAAARPAGIITQTCGEVVRDLRRGGAGKDQRRAGKGGTLEVKRMKTVKKGSIVRFKGPSGRTLEGVCVTEPDEQGYIVVTVNPFADVFSLKVASLF